MMETITIEGYRGLRHLDLASLGRVNLLVGKNNSGKSSVLEAILLLENGGDPYDIWDILWRRGERTEDSDDRRSLEADVAHLFFGHQVGPNAQIMLASRNSSSSRVILRTTEEPNDELPLEAASGIDTDAYPKLHLIVNSSHEAVETKLALTSRGGLADRNIRFRTRSASNRLPRARLLGVQSPSAREQARYWDDIALTQDEDRVLAALRFIAPDIERIAATTTAQLSNSGIRGGFIVKLRNERRPVPIGSLGDGIWRLLAISIALVRARDSVLLVDEIDTGLHYTVLEKMWRLVAETARELNVQVFATTHSQDCVNSLASICGTTNAFDVTIQRIEVGREKAVAYDEAEIRAAADSRIELR